MHDRTSTITTDDARRYLADVGISDPTPNLVDRARVAAKCVADALADDPTTDDYAGTLTAIADDIAATISLTDLAGSEDALTFDHGFGAMESLAEQTGATAFGIMDSVVQTAYDDLRPDPEDVRWSEVPTISRDGVLVGRTTTGFVYVSVKVKWNPDRLCERLSITGVESNGSAGQIHRSLSPDDITPAPWYTAHDIAELWRVWDRWHLNDMSAACEHQRAAAEAWGMRTSDAWGVGEHCPVCDYAYGHEWIVERVPADVLAFLRRFQTDHDDAVRDILRRVNPAEPGGEWSTFDLAAVLDPDAHTPRRMFDTAGPGPSEDWLAYARSTVGRLCPGGGRYVGGTSGQLYSLPYDAEVDR